jgi:CDGSH-type Zn-finger protein
MSEDAVTITPLENGPYLVKGPVTVLDADGAEYQIERATIALCRCGGSTTKPFCDGTHSRIGFQAAEAAVAKQDDDR